MCIKIKLSESFVNSIPTKSDQVLYKRDMATPTTYIRPKIRSPHQKASSSIKVSLGMFDPASTMGQILFPVPRVPVTKPEVLFGHWKTYLRHDALNSRRTGALSLSLLKKEDIIIRHQRVDTLRKLIRVWKEVSKKHEEKINVPDDPNHIIVRTRVTSKGKVKVALEQPYKKLYDRYLDFTTPPPSLEEKIFYAQQFGYPERVLKNIMKAHDRREAQRPKIEELIIRVFGETKSKTYSKPKKKSLIKQISTRVKKYNSQSETETETETQ